MASSNSGGREYEYNTIFERLVVDTDSETKERLIGMLAYAEYKDEKYRWKRMYCNRHDVTSIPNEAVEDFLLSYHDEAKLDKLKNDAEEILYVFAEHYASDKEEEAYDRGKKDVLITAFGSLETAVSSKIDNQVDGFWKTGIKGALGSLFFAVLLIMVSIVFALGNPDSNYSKLVHFMSGGKDFIVISSNDCRLKNITVDCE